MKFGDIIKCPKCGEVINGDTIIIKRDNIINEDAPSYFSEDEKKLCREKDNLFIKANCEKCGPFRAMIIVDVKPVACYTAEDNSNLVMIDK